MIGTDPGLILPSTSETYSVTVARIATALEALATSIADKATPAALNVISDLSIGGNQLTNVAKLILSDITATGVGSLYYSNGNFYLIDATNTIQLTSAGSINVAGVGGIGGDYGGTNPAVVTYDSASEEYRFKKDSTHYGDLKADDLLLMEPGASPVDAVRITAQAMASGYTLTLPAALPGTQQLVQVDTSGNIIASNTVPQDVTLSANKSITVSGTGDLKHGDRTETAPFGFNAKTPTGALSISYTSNKVKWTLDAAGVSASFFPSLRVGRRIKSVKVTGSSASAASLTIVIQNGNTTPSIGSVSNSGNFTAGSETVTLTTPYTVTAGDMLQAVVAAGASTVDLYDVEVTYDNP